MLAAGWADYKKYVLLLHTKVHVLQLVNKALIVQWSLLSILCGQ